MSHHAAKSEMWTDVRPEQPENAKRPMLVTLSGIVTDESPEQPENARAPMLVTPSGIVIDERSEQPENAHSPMLVTPSGIVATPWMPTISFLASFESNSPFLEE